MDRTHRKFRRRDGSGHLDPEYEAMLLAGSGGSANGDRELAFLGRPWSVDPLAEERAGDFVVSVTSGQDEAQELLDRTLPEEEGGPFVETSGKTEFAYE
jgi:hypothetical protein